MLRRRDGRDRVELEIPEAADRVEHAFRRSVEELRANSDPARLVTRNLDPRGLTHRLCSNAFARAPCTGAGSRVRQGEARARPRRSRATRSRRSTRPLPTGRSSGGSSSRSWRTTPASTRSSRAASSTTWARASSRTSIASRGRSRGRAVRARRVRPRPARRRDCRLVRGPAPDPRGGRSPEPPTQRGAVGAASRLGHAVGRPAARGSEPVRGAGLRGRALPLALPGRGRERGARGVACVDGRDRGAGLPLRRNAEARRAFEPV